MKKFIISSLFLIVLAVFAVSCGKKTPDEHHDTDSDPAEINDSDSNSGTNDNDGTPIDSNKDNTSSDCNYSSADNRIKPKNEELLFSGIIFGETSLTKYIYIMNRCYSCDPASPLSIKSITIVDKDGNAEPGTFVIESNPLDNGAVNLQNDEEIEIGVSVKASTWEDQVRYLRIKSNDKCKPEFDIPLTAQTKPTGRIKVKTLDDDEDDEILMFTDVLSELVNQIEIYNEGISLLKLSSVSISEGQSKNSNEMGFFIQEAPEPGISIAPGEKLTLDVGCRNDKEYPSPLTGELLITNTDPTEYGANAEKRIALKCGPNVKEYPTARLKCEPEKVSVFQWAVMDGGESTDSDGESKDGLRYLWSFSTTPGGISLDIVDDSNRAGTPLNGDPSNKISRAAFQAKIKGSYTVKLVVINEKGVSSVPAECTVEAISDDDLAVKMLWNNKNSDIDLHLIRPDGEFGDLASDCYYWNCSPQYPGERPDWGVEGETKDNPFIDIDNTDGIGPETVTINKPENGIYKVIVHAYDTSKGPSTVVLKAYAHGVEEKTASLLMNQSDTCWDVFTIEVEDGSESKKKITIKEITPVQTYECSRPTH
ncbi:hypothetical protein J6Z19_03570 [bacterium]|nr:hypothetical protein [bacterium]